MPTIGPTLPPHLQKRKRSTSGSSDSGSDNPSPPAAKRPRSPHSPSSKERSAATKSRPVGPTTPPAPLNQRPSHAANPTSTKPENDDDSSSSDDSDFGPALPGAATDPSTAARQQEEAQARAEADAKAEAARPKRDEWMLAPPSADGLGSRAMNADPAKALKARGFNSGKGARGPAERGDGGATASWMEKPEEKLKRLQDEAMGITARAEPREDSHEAWRVEQRKVRAIREQEEKKRNMERYREERGMGESLYEMHQKKRKGDGKDKAKEDDPSKRVFDYEKDVAKGTGLGSKDRKEMVKRAKGGFGGKFSGGSYL